MAKAILYTVDRRTRSYDREELEESRIRKMRRVERIHDFMLKSNDKYMEYVNIDIIDGFAVYRIID